MNTWTIEGTLDFQLTLNARLSEEEMVGIKN